MPRATADGMKVCVTCKINKPVTEFHNRQELTDKRCPYCKACKREKWRRGEGKPLFPAANGMKKCAWCRVVQPVTEFHNRQEPTDKRCPYCKTCKREKWREYVDSKMSSNPNWLEDERTRKREHAAKMRTDPDWAERQRVACREYRARHKDDPEWVEHRRQRERNRDPEHKRQWRARKKVEDPEWHEREKQKDRDRRARKKLESA